MSCLGLRPLKDLCSIKSGDFENRLRMISWEEIKQSQERGKKKKTVVSTLHVQSGDYWILIDGGVFDVTRWLPNHPGGTRIIPKQALGVDSTVFFEIYHSSRESFTYLKEFYIGELPEDDLEVRGKKI